MSNIVSPHVLLELYKREWFRMKNNSIVISQRYDENIEKKNKVFYKSILYGKNIRKHLVKSKDSSGNCIGWMQIDVDNMKGKYIAIVCPKEEIHNHQNIFVTEKIRYGDNQCRKPEVSSRYLLLSLAVLQKKKKQDEVPWGINEYKIVQSLKINIISKHNNHNNSEGQYYSYGNKGSFSKVTNSSVGQYANRQFKDQHKQHMSNLKNDFMHSLTAKELRNGINSLCNLLPYLKANIAPVVNTAAKLQENSNSLNLKKMSRIRCGLLANTNLCKCEN